MRAVARRGAQRQARFAPSVFDVGFVQGGYLLTMQYIDGEDLASLLRRIGRLPARKALKIARQLCAGLAAAHWARARGFMTPAARF